MLSLLKWEKAQWAYVPIPHLGVHAAILTLGGWGASGSESE